MSDSDSDWENKPSRIPSCNEHAANILDKIELEVAKLAETSTKADTRIEKIGASLLCYLKEFCEQFEDGEDNLVDKKLSGFLDEQGIPKHKSDKRPLTRLVRITKHKNNASFRNKLTDALVVAYQLNIRASELPRIIDCGLPNDKEGQFGTGTSAFVKYHRDVLKEKKEKKCNVEQAEIDIMAIEDVTIVERMLPICVAFLEAAIKKMDIAIFVKSHGELTIKIASVEQLARDVIFVEVNRSWYDRLT